MLSCSTTCYQRDTIRCQHALIYCNVDAADGRTNTRAVSEDGTMDRVESRAVRVVLQGSVGSQSKCEYERNGSQGKANTII